MTFSNEPTLWRPSVVAPSEENCEDAVEWIKTFQAYGGACTVEALQVSLIARLYNQGYQPPIRFIIWTLDNYRV